MSGTIRSISIYLIILGALIFLFQRSTQCQEQQYLYLCYKGKQTQDRTIRPEDENILRRFASIVEGFDTFNNTRRLIAVDHLDKADSIILSGFQLIRIFEDDPALVDVTKEAPNRQQLNENLNLWRLRAIPLTPNPLITEMLSGITQGYIKSHINILNEGTNTRYTWDSAGISRAKNNLIDFYQRIQRLNVSANVYYDTMGRPIPVVVAELVGRNLSRGIYIMSSHFDSLSEDPYNQAPGADDDGSGTAALMMAARIMASFEFEATIRFVSFAGEEQGLWGSYYYAEEMSNNDEDIRGVLNLDMISWESDGHSFMDVHDGTGSDSGLLAEAFMEVQNTYLVNIIPERCGSHSTNLSDHYSFWRFGYPAILIIEDFEPFPKATNDFNTSNYHKTTDTIMSLETGNHLDFSTEITKTVIGTIAMLAEPVRKIDFGCQCE